MHYVDTSVLVAALVNETHTDAAQRWLSGQPVGSLHISDWVASEFSAALAMKLRGGQLTSVQRNEVLGFFTQLVARSFRVLTVSRADFHDAARFADRAETGLRAGDALHLAIAANAGLTLVTLDRRLAESGVPLGVATRDLR